MIQRLPYAQRQLIFYVAFGFTQLFVDWAGFLLLSHIGVPLAVANPTSRLFAAVVGYLLNATLTFKRSALDRHVNVGSFLRYAALWLATTVCSTLLIAGATSIFGNSSLPIVKLLVEGIMACLSFVSMKFWVYRHPK